MCVYTYSSVWLVILKRRSLERAARYALVGGHFGAPRSPLGVQILLSGGRSPNATSPTRRTVTLFYRTAARMRSLNLKLASHRGDQAKTNICRYPVVSTGHVLPTFQISKLDKPPGGSLGSPLFKIFILELCLHVLGVVLVTLAFILATLGSLPFLSPLSYLSTSTIQLGQN